MNQIVTLASVAESVGVASVTALVAPYLTNRFTRKRAARAHADTRRRDAAQHLRGLLSDLHELAWDPVGRDAQAAEVASAMRSFDRAARTYSQLLPQGAGHLRGSTREAMANVFGPPALSALSGAAASAPMDTPEPYWVDVATTWLSYASARLDRWQDHPGVHRLELEPFCKWRRAEDDNYHRQRRANGKQASWSLGNASDDRSAHRLPMRD
jgi:hypothetical protein